MDAKLLAQSVENPLLPTNVIDETGVAYTSELLNNFLGLFLIAIFLIFFGYLIFAAIGWITSGGDKSKVEAAKGRVTTAIIGIGFMFSVWAIVGLVEFFFSVDILNMDVSMLFLNKNSYWVIENPLLNNTTRDVAGSSYTTAFVSAGIVLAMVVGAVVFFFMFVLGGIQTISSGGDKGKIESARSKITNALIGFVILLAIWAVVALIEVFFGVELFSLDFSNFYLI